MYCLYAVAPWCSCGCGLIVSARVLLTVGSFLWRVVSGAFPLAMGLFTCIAKVVVGAGALSVYLLVASIPCSPTVYG